MHFVQIFIVNVPVVIRYIYIPIYMMLLRSNLKKSTFYPVFKNSLFVILKMLHIFDYDQYHTKINI